MNNSTLNKDRFLISQSKRLTKSSGIILSLFLIGLFFITGCKKDEFTGEIFGECPVVVSTDPLNEAVDVALAKVISATFNTAMNPETVNDRTFTISLGSANIEGTVAPTADSARFTFTPDVPLLPFTEYTGTITTGATDTLRTAMEENYQWTFTTIPQVLVTSSPVIGGTTTGGGSFTQSSEVELKATANDGYRFVNWTEDGTIVSTDATFNLTMDGNKELVANYLQRLPGDPEDPEDPTNPGDPGNPGTGIGPNPINLRSAGDFGILSKAGISTTGLSSIIGDIGVSPSAATSITGFGLIMDASNQFSRAPIVTGRVYAADYAAPTPAKMTTAISDMETAFTTANGLVTPAPIVDLYAGDISGRVLPAGLYKYSTGVLITNEGVTLSGGPNDVWVFQIAQGLTVNSNAKVTLLGGAQAKNVFWVVSGIAGLGTGVDFSGNILGKTNITLNTGARVTGRLLAQTAVTLNASTVIKP